MNIIVSLIIGGIIGWLGSILMKTNAQMGVVANVVVGIVGSMVGFWLASLLGLAVGGPLMAWLAAVGGAVLLIAVLKMFRVFA